NTIMDLRALPRGRLAFGAADPTWGVIDGRRIVFSQAPPTPDYRIDTSAFRASRNGSVVEFTLATWTENDWRRRTTRFDVEQPTLLVEVPAANDLVPPRTEGLAVTDWKNTVSPKLGGEPLKLSEYELSTSLAVTADASQFVLGTLWYI